MKLVVVGAGDVGGRVAARWVAQGGRAVGITQTTDRHAALAAAGVEPSIASPPSLIDEDDLVLLSISGSANQELGALGLSGCRAQRAVMTSTTGYYGGVDGHISPDTPPGPTDRAQAAARAEAAFIALPMQTVIVRLGGLYRPGRGPISPTLRRGSAPVGPPDRPLALIHRDDAATALLAALTHASPRRAYLGIVQPLPTRRAFYTAVCERHGLPAPKFTEELGLTWRYDTTATTADLLPHPAHPDWREATLSGDADG